MAIRGEIPASDFSYSRDVALGATVEHVNGETFVVELIEGKLMRVVMTALARVEARRVDHSA